jgi:hypothetical protein
MIAIVIPYYKISFFEKLLKSLIEQTNKNFNVYIGDDASLEDPRDILGKYKNQLNLVYKKFNENFGSKSLVKQWERCINLIEDEEWIMLLGDDDFLECNVIDNFYKQYDTFKNKSNLVRFATKTQYIETSELTRTFLHPKWETAEQSFYRKFKGKTRSSLSEHIFTRKAYNKFKFTEFPLAWHSDDKAWLDFPDKLPIYTINEAVVIISVSNKSISGGGSISNPHLKFKAQKLFYKSLLRNRSYNFSSNMYADITRGFEYVSIRINDFKISDWMFTNKCYIFKLDIISLLKFNKRGLGRLIRR